MAYDRQLILVLLNGQGDSVIRRNAELLQKVAKRKGLPSEVIHVTSAMKGLFKKARSKAKMANLEKAVSKLTSESRLYLQGHGDWESQHLADWDADGVCEMLSGIGGQKRSVFWAASWDGISGLRTICGCLRRSTASG